MTSWMKERDRLLEQTLAFVQGVTAKRPITVAASMPVPASVPEVPAAKEASVAVTEAPLFNQPPVASNVVLDTSSTETDSLMSLMALSHPVQALERDVLTTELIVVADDSQPIRVAAKAAVHHPVVRRPVDIVLPERELIAQRVARFRAAQQKTLQDREINYEAMQAKIRATLGNDPIA